MLPIEYDVISEVTERGGRL